MFTQRYLKLLSLSTVVPLIRQQVSLSEVHNQLFSFAHICVSSISYKHACRTSTFEIMNLSAQKTRHVNGPSSITKPNAMHVFSLSTVPRCEREVLYQRAVALVVQTRCADVKPL